MADQPRALDDVHIRRFVLDRKHDVTGVSGTGIVAVGCLFVEPDLAVVHWLSEFPTSVVWHHRGLESIEAVHGHGGHTEIVFLDPPAAPVIALPAELSDDDLADLQRRFAAQPLIMRGPAEALATITEHGIATPELVATLTNAIGYELYRHDRTVTKVEGNNFALELTDDETERCLAAAHRVLRELGYQ